MSFFGTILDKLGLSKTEAAPAAAAPQATAAPESKSTATDAASPAPVSVVDVSAHLEARAAANTHKLNWKQSIIDLLRLLDIDSSHAARKDLATELGCPVELMDDFRVVAACFNAMYDPDAPEIVPVGRGPIIEGTAEQFAAQGNAVSTFLKRGVNCWEYAGSYRAIRHSRDREEILRLAERAKRVGDVTSVLFLERSG